MLWCYCCSCVVLPYSLWALSSSFRSVICCMAARRLPLSCLSLWHSSFHCSGSENHKNPLLSSAGGYSCFGYKRMQNVSTKPLHNGLLWLWMRWWEWWLVELVCVRHQMRYNLWGMWGGMCIWSLFRHTNQAHYQAGLPLNSCTLLISSKFFKVKNALEILWIRRRMKTQCAICVQVQLCRYPFPFAASSSNNRSPNSCSKALSVANHFLKKGFLYCLWWTVAFFQRSPNQLNHGSCGTMYLLCWW